MLEPFTTPIQSSDMELIGPLRDQPVPTAGPLPPPPRYDDHYGFNRLSCTEF